MPASLANSTACAFSTFAPDSASSCVSSYESVPMRCARHDARIGGVDAVHVRADLAVFGAERGGHRDGGRVAAAAAERRDLAAVRHALIAGDDDDLSARQLVLDADRTHFDDARVHVPIVGDDAGLAAGEADRVAASSRIAIDSSAIEIRSPVVSSMSSSRRSGLADTCLASDSSSSVVSPIADTTTTTSCPARACASRARRPAAARDVGDARAAVFLDDDGHQCRCHETRRTRRRSGCFVLRDFVANIERRDDGRVVAGADILLHRTCDARAASASLANT
jgi:hypothetical protein